MILALLLSLFSSFPVIESKPRTMEPLVLAPVAEPVCTTCPGVDLPNPWFGWDYPPIPACPEGQTRDQTQVDKCKAAFYAAFLVAYNTANNAYNNAVVAYSIAADVCETNYNDCLAMGQTPSICRLVYSQCCQAAASTATSAINAAVAANDNSKAQATSDFYICLAANAPCK